ncbi:MAG: dTMP kinase [Opitutales bacterium]|jgi:dTMP kinase
MKSNDDTRGFLITFEGSEGAGKSTQVERIAQRFEAHNYEVMVTREPGGTPIGEEIRRLLMTAACGQAMKPETELLLFAASRAQLVREVIRPAVEAGKVVLCDRFLDSTTVYQGVGRRIASEPVSMINTFAVGDLMPDVTVVIDLPAEIGLERTRHRAREMPDRMEQENIEFYRKVREGYLMLAKALPGRFIIVDGTKSIEEVEKAIWGALRKVVV